MLTAEFLNDMIIKLKTLYDLKTRRSTRFSPDRRSIAVDWFRTFLNDWRRVGAFCTDAFLMYMIRLSIEIRNMQNNFGGGWLLAKI